MEKNIPLVIGHRGAPRDEAENTIASFMRALELGADGIEFDVRLNHDGEPVVTHDEVFDRPDTPTLSETYDRLALENVQLIVEIKGQPGLAEKVVKKVGLLTRRHTFLHPPILSSSNLSVLTSLNKQHPDIARAYIIRYPVFSFFQAWLFDKLFHISGAHVKASGLSKVFADRCHKLGLHHFVWTVNDPATARKACDLGIDGIITDDIAMVKNAIQSFRGK